MRVHMTPPKWLMVFIAVFLPFQTTLIAMGKSGVEEPCANTGLRHSRAHCPPK